ncbi:MAG TPA: hypothetical protein VI636_01155 [Candidatus Angelobacter sp.]
MRKVSFATLLVLVFAVLSSAQQQAPPAPPQSPRQALLEMFNGQAALWKHLTVEVQQLLSQPENKQALVAMGMTSSIKSELGEDVQLFESGPVLMSINQPGMHRKLEVQVNNDDLNGDQDAMELSVHSFHDGREQQEQDEEWQAFLSHFTVTMVRQQDVWRLSKIGVNVELAIGDPEFLKKTYLRSMSGGGGMVGGRVGSGVHVTATTDEEAQHIEVPPNTLVMMMGFAEQSFARQHADVGFTCSLEELVQAASTNGMDPQQIAGGSYKGYKISLSGCQGKPAGSFQLVMEPMPGKGGKAYCVDATQNMRVSDDGRGSTCLSAGRPDRVALDEAGSVGVDSASEGPPAKPKE